MPQLFWTGFLSLRQNMPSLTSNMDNHFVIFVIVSFVTFVGLIRFCLRRRSDQPKASRILIVASLVVVAGMYFARWGVTSGLPWWFYYTIPAATTLIVPPVAFRLSRKEVIEYLVLAFLMAPSIHIVFSFLFGWKEYMPFIEIPSLRELF